MTREGGGRRNDLEIRREKEGRVTYFSAGTGLPEVLQVFSCC